MKYPFERVEKFINKLYSLNIREWKHGLGHGFGKLPS